ASEAPLPQAASNTKSGLNHPRPKSSTGPPASSGRRRSSPRTDHVKLFLRLRREAVRPASEVDRLRRHQNPDACRNRNHFAAFTARSTFVSVVTSLPGPTRTTAAPSAISIVPHENCAGARRSWRRSLSLHHDRRESRAARDGGALTTDGSPLRIAPPAEQLLRGQSMSTCDCRDLVPTFIALCENPRLLLRRPDAPSARSGEDLKPTNGLTLRLVQKLSVRHVSNPLPNRATSDSRPLASAFEGGV